MGGAQSLRSHDFLGTFAAPMPVLINRVVQKPERHCALLPVIANRLVGEAIQKLQLFAGRLYKNVPILFFYPWIASLRSQ